jgi:hypothetical protein
MFTKQFKQIYSKLQREFSNLIKKVDLDTLARIEQLKEGEWRDVDDEPELADFYSETYNKQLRADRFFETDWLLYRETQVYGKPPYEYYLGFIQTKKNKIKPILLGRAIDDNYSFLIAVEDLTKFPNLDEGYGEILYNLAVIVEKLSKLFGQNN